MRNSNISSLATTSWSQFRESACWRGLAEPGIAGANYSKYLHVAGWVTSDISIQREEGKREIAGYFFLFTWILFEPRLRNLRLSRAARAAMGMDSRKLFESSSSTRLETPEDNITDS